MSKTAYHARLAEMTLDQYRDECRQRIAAAREAARHDTRNYSAEWLMSACWAEAKDKPERERAYAEALGAVKAEESLLRRHNQEVRP